MQQLYKHPPSRPLRFILRTLFVLAITATCAHAQLNLFRVLAPNGGENLVVDSTFAIRWIAQGVSGPLAIEYSADSGAVWHPIDTVTARAGFDTLFWKVPDDTTRRAFIRITALDSGKIARSQRVFNIVSKPVPTLRVVQPNGGEVYQYDSVARVIWTGTNLSGELQVHYSIDSGSTWRAIGTKTARTGPDTLSWTIPHDSTTKGMVRVRMADSSIGDASNRTFTIKGSVKPQITILYPNGGETLFADSTVRLRWTAQDVTGLLFAEYSVDSGATWKGIGTRQARAGLDSLVWKVPNDSSRKALVRIGPTQGPRDTSDRVFTIKGRDSVVTPPAAALTLRYPNGGERLRADSVVYIKWEASNLTGRIGVQLSTDNGATWTLVDTTSAKTEIDSMRWVVPNDSTTTARIRISAQTGTIRDTSDAVFTILPRASTTGVPAGGDDAGSLRIIGLYPNPASGRAIVRWSQPSAGEAELRLYDNAGRTVATLAAGYREQGTQELALDVAGLPAGAYHYELRTARATATGIVSVVR